MKRTFIILLVAVSAFSSIAQNSSERKQNSPNTLIGTDPDEISGFGASLFTFTGIDGQLATLSGGGGAVIFDNTFFIGGYGLGMSGDRRITVNGQEMNMHFGHGGFWMGYIMKPVELVHLSIETKLGWGEIKYSSNDALNDKVFVFYPQINGEVNLSYWMKINAGVGFQKTVGVDELYFSKTDFDGLAFSISLLFGWFK